MEVWVLQLFVHFWILLGILLGKLELHQDDDSPLYLFDHCFGEYPSTRTLLDHYDVPKIFGEELLGQGGVCGRNCYLFAAILSISQPLAGGCWYLVVIEPSASIFPKRKVWIYVGLGLSTTLVFSWYYGSPINCQSCGIVYRLDTQPWDGKLFGPWWCSDQIESNSCKIRQNPLCPI